MKDEEMAVNEALSQWLRSCFVRAFPGAPCDFSGVRAVGTANPHFGDYQCNDAMTLAALLKKSPQDIAQAAVDKATLPDSLERVEVAPPGFINMHLKSEWLVTYLCGIAEDEWLGVPALGEGRTVIMDYSSPNVAKPMHVGHIRSTIIGSSLDRMYRFLRYRVISDNHIGDWGTQFGILIMGYRHFVDKEALEEAPVEELLRLYVKSYAMTQEDPEWLEQCRRELVKLQTGDQENRTLWKQFVDLSLAAFAKTYRRLGVSFDLVRGESHYSGMLADTLLRLQQKGLVRESEGAQVVFLDDEKLPVCIVRKRDGGFNYSTTDIATLISRVAEFKPERIVYVTDERQQLHFRQIFTICRKLGYATCLDHVWFGLMRLPEGILAAREGKVIELDRLLDEAERRALEIVRESSPDMDPGQQKEIARVVGIGAVKYADLSQNPQTAVTFTWDKALALDGNSGPYLQYAHARIAGVWDKYRGKFPGKDPASFPIVFTEPIERALAAKLARFPETVPRAAHCYRPNLVADYLYELAQLYSTFYQNVPFLQAEEGVRESRVRLCGITAKILRTGLGLLGIDAPQRI